MTVIHTDPVLGETFLHVGWVCVKEQNKPRYAFIVYAHIGIWGIWFLARCEMCSMRALLKPAFPWCLELQLLQEKILNRISELGLDEQVSEMLCEMYQACFLALWFQLSLQHCAPKTNYVQINKEMRCNKLTEQWLWRNKCVSNLWAIIPRNMWSNEPSRRLPQGKQMFVKSENYNLTIEQCFI